MSQSYVCLHYHFVFSTKNRAPVITPEIQTRLWEYLGGTVLKLGGTPIQIGGIEDHVHMLVTLRQEPSVADVLRDIKAASSGWVHDTLPDLHEFWWQGGYGAFSVSHSNIDKVKAYIARQKEHHGEMKMGFKDELRKLLKKHGVAFKTNTWTDGRARVPRVCELTLAAPWANIRRPSGAEDRREP